MIKEKFFAELNKPQLEATLNDINSCTKIVAGAGCGKTKVIASRYLKLVLDMQENKIEDPLSKILVITFTDKAAGEMKERIEKILNKAEIDVFGKKIWVSTFHKWTLEILKKHSIEVGLNPNFELVDEVREKEIYSEIEEKFKNLKTSEIENFDSICADLKISPNILEGKKFKNLLKIMPIQEIFDEIYRIIKQIKSKGLTPCEFLQTTVSSTQKFSKHLEQLNRYQYTKEDYIAHWARVLENYSDENCDFESAFEEIAGKKIIIDKNGQRKPENWLIKEDYLQKILEIEEIEIIFAKTIALIYAIFQAELSKRSLADFDDLINKTLEIFKTKPNILKKYKNQFKHIIIDEFQDTNGAQLELIKLILADNEANITFVGDRKQSIYGFRYAQMENLEVLHDVIQKKYNKNYPEISLNINYRSTPKILEKVNVLVEKYLKLNEKLNSGGEFKEEFSVIKKTIENPTSSSDIELRQAEYMVSEILDLKEKHNYKFSDFAILVSSHTEADFIEEILAKNNIAANKKVNKSFFKSKNVKNLKAMLRLANDRSDEIALIKILYLYLSESEIYSLKKALDKAIDGVYDTYKLNFAQKFFLKETKEVVENFNSEIFKLRTLYEKINRFKPAIDIFIELNSAINLINYKSNWENFKAQLEIKTFEKIILNWQKEKTYAPVYEFLKHFEEVSQMRDFELPKVIISEENAVNIMTVHASKGLEYKNIFVTNKIGKPKKAGNNKFVFDLAWGGKSPFGIVLKKYLDKDTPKAKIYSEYWAKPREQAECLRLFYVAITRASENLRVISFETYAKTQKPIAYHDIFD